MIKKNKAQSIIEFCFATTILMLLVYGLVQAVRWVMMDLAERRFDHENVLVSSGDASNQLTPNFHDTRSLDAVLFHKKEP